MPTFCRHNRFVADCAICSKGTVLDPNQQASRRAPRTTRTAGGTRRSARQADLPRTSRGPFVSAGPYDGAEVRLERVPGGLRLASWRGGQIERIAPMVDVADLPGLLAEAAAKELLPLTAATEASQTTPEPGVFGASAGRTGELRDELRAERVDGGRVRLARWIMRPNRGWELQEAPVMLPPKRFTEALAAAARKGVLALSAQAVASGGPGE